MLGNALQPNEPVDPRRRRAHRTDVVLTLGDHMVKVGLLVRMEARAGKEDAVAQFLEGALPLVEREPGTTAWFAVRFGPSSFAIFDVFDDEQGRDAHLAGEVAKALTEKGPDLLVAMPALENNDVLAAKLPT